MMALPAQPTLWHAHAMLFGYAAALIAGFVLTAVANWTGQQPTTPTELATLVVLWLSARLAALFPYGAWQLVASIADCLFLPMLAWLMARVLLKTRNRRNYLFIPFLSGLALVNIGFHWALFQDRPELARLLVQFTAYLVGFLMVFMGGRVIPFFSTKRLQYQPVQWPWLNWVSTLSALLAGALQVNEPLSGWAAAAAATAALTTLLRLLLWQPWRAWREPMLWILHCGYAWLAVAYLLAAAVSMGWLHAPTLPIHALMAGALGCLGLGMMTRVALGHTGRPIQASPAMLVAFVLVIIAGLLRVASYGPWAWSGLPSLTIGAICWSMAFMLYFLVFAPRLWR